MLAYKTSDAFKPNKQTFDARIVVGLDGHAHFCIANVARKTMEIRRQTHTRESETHKRRSVDNVKIGLGHDASSQSQTRRNERHVFCVGEHFVESVHVWIVEALLVDGCVHAVVIACCVFPKRAPQRPACKKEQITIQQKLDDRNVPLKLNNVSQR